MITRRSAGYTNARATILSRSAVKGPCPDLSRPDDRPRRAPPRLRHCAGKAPAAQYVTVYFHSDPLVTEFSERIPRGRMCKKNEVIE